MAANMYRVGGMYVNVDLFIKEKPLQFCTFWALFGVILSCLHLMVEMRMCYSNVDALS